MKPTGQELEIQKSQAAKPGIAPALMTCVMFVVGTLGAVMIAAGPWVLLGWYL